MAETEDQAKWKLCRALYRKFAKKGLDDKEFVEMMQMGESIRDQLGQNILNSNDRPVLDQYGIPKKLGYQAHHLIPRRKSFSEHPIWAKANMTINDQENILYLPDKAAQYFVKSESAVHEGRHNKESGRQIKEKLNETLNLANMQNWDNTELYKKALLQVIEAERQNCLTQAEYLNTTHVEEHLILNRKRVELEEAGKMQTKTSSILINKSIEMSNTGFSAGNGEKEQTVEPHPLIDPNIYNMVKGRAVTATPLPFKPAFLQPNFIAVQPQLTHLDHLRQRFTPKPQPTLRPLPQPQAQPKPVLRPLPISSAPTREYRSLPVPSNTASLQSLKNTSHYNIHNPSASSPHYFNAPKSTPSSQPKFNTATLQSAPNYKETFKPLTISRPQTSVPKADTTNRVPNVLLTPAYNNFLSKNQPLNARVNMNAQKFAQSSSAANNQPSINSSISNVKPPSFNSNAKFEKCTVKPQSYATKESQNIGITRPQSAPTSRATPPQRTPTANTEHKRVQEQNTQNQQQNMRNQQAQARQQQMQIQQQNLRQQQMIQQQERIRQQSQQQMRQQQDRQRQEQQRTQQERARQQEQQRQQERQRQEQSRQQQERMRQQSQQQMRQQQDRQRQEHQRMQQERARQQEQQRQQERQRQEQVRQQQERLRQQQQQMRQQQERQRQEQQRMQQERARQQEQQRQQERQRQEQVRQQQERLRQQQLQHERARQQALLTQQRNTQLAYQRQQQQLAAQRAYKK